MASFKESALNYKYLALCVYTVYKLMAAGEGGMLGLECHCVCATESTKTRYK